MPERPAPPLAGSVPDQPARTYAARMCGRFTQHYTWHELVALYWLTQPAISLRPLDDIMGRRS